MYVYTCSDCSETTRIPIALNDPAYQWTLQDLVQLPPTDPRRASFVLAYLRGGAGTGIGEFEWATIHAALEVMAVAPPIPPGL